MKKCLRAIYTLYKEKQHTYHGQIYLFKLDSLVLKNILFSTEEQIIHRFGTTCLKWDSILSEHISYAWGWTYICISGWYEGERLRDGERGWFLSECAEHITCQVTIEKNMQRMDRLQGLETNVWVCFTPCPSHCTWRRLWMDSNHYRI